MGLTAGEFRDAIVPVTVAMSDEALQLILDGTWSALTAVAGPGGTITELRDGGGTYVILDFRAASIASISERWGDTTTELEATDYEIRGDRRSVRRRSDGDNPSTLWVGVVEVTYQAEDRDAALQLAQLQLMKLELSSNPGLAGFVVGNFSVQFQQGKSYQDLRADILASVTRNWSFA